MSNSKSSQRTSRIIIDDIAEKSGFSPTTISRVLNGHPDVSVTTRDKVMQYAHELGYIPQKQTRSAATLIGLSVPMFNNFFGKIIEGASEALLERNAQFVIATTNNTHDREVSQLQLLLRQSISGILFIFPQENPEELLKLHRKGIPFVITDPFMPLPNEIPVVMVENISGGMIATEHLLNLGHRRIGLITGPPHWGTTIDRVAGYYSVLASAGIPIDPTLIREGRWMADSGHEAADYLLALPDPPTAIFAFNDDMAIGAIHSAWEHGLRVPEDFSVIGFDDALENLSYSIPPLTTMRQPLKEVGRLAIDVLYRILNRQPLEATHIKLSARLILRGSTGPCKGS